LYYKLIGRLGEIKELARYQKSAVILRKSLKQKHSRFFDI